MSSEIDTHIEPDEGDSARPELIGQIKRLKTAVTAGTNDARLEENQIVMPLALGCLFQFHPVDIVDGATADLQSVKYRLACFPPFGI
ncbi:hypothetical protein [Phyllobacterium lublinensis]|uniref:hypothetical protein n=1 Tax=Phyllobacterium lublinensis TaxID=2875708 RepID=UPI001CCB302B|nr:hypothetical protein [Phyllobacterium sp. 2063]MBZ9653541.1 hypothetical protein [Phyllobacterium sp. 2063]